MRRQYIRPARAVVCLALVVVLVRPAAAAVANEYRVKASHILNIAKYVEWPADALGGGNFTICVAGQNPFGSLLDETVQGHQVAGRPVVVRIILEPEAGCHVMFIPRNATQGAYLRFTSMSPVLTIGERADFLKEGGIVLFVNERDAVRFIINRDAAARVNLRISSQLLRLGRPDRTSRP